MSVGGHRAKFYKSRGLAPPLGYGQYSQSLQSECFQTVATFQIGK